MSVHQKICRALIGLLVFWPAIHFVIVQKFDVNPWKLMGFAMYSTQYTLEVDVLDESTGRPVSFNSVSKETWQFYSGFVDRKNVYGKLLEYSEVGERLLAELPGVDALIFREKLRKLEFDGVLRLYVEEQLVERK